MFTDVTQEGQGVVDQENEEQEVITPVSQWKPVPRKGNLFQLKIRKHEMSSYYH